MRAFRSYPGAVFHWFQRAGWCFYARVAGNSVALFAFGLPATFAPPFPAFLACLGRIDAALIGRRLGLGLRWFGRRFGRLRRRVDYFMGLRRRLSFFRSRGGYAGLWILRRLGCRRGIVFGDIIAEQCSPSGIECFGACRRVDIRVWRRRRLGRRLGRGLRFCFAWGLGCLFIRGGFCLLSGRGRVLLSAAAIGLEGSLPGGFRCGGWRHFRGIYVAFDNVFVGEDGARAVGQLHLDELCQNMRAGDPADLVARLDPDIFMRQAFFQVAIALVFISQAAHEPAASPRDLGRVERSLLRLGHAHRNRLEAFEKLSAAAYLSAAFVVADEACFVACPDLAHFDAGVILAGEFVDQFAEVHSMFGQEVEYDPLAAEEVFDGHQFHIERQILYFLGAEFSFVFG